MRDERHHPFRLHGQVVVMDSECRLLEFSEILAGKDNHIPHVCSRRSQRQHVMCLQRELHRHPNGPSDDMIKANVTRTIYTTPDGTYIAIYKRLFPVTKLLRQGGDTFMEAVAKVHAKKTELKC